VVPPPKITDTNTTIADKISLLIDLYSGDKERLKAEISLLFADTLKAEFKISPVDNSTITIEDKEHHKAIVPYKDLMEMVTEGIFCVNVDGIILFANEAFCRNLGYSKGEILNNSIFNFFVNEEAIKYSKNKMELRKKGVSDSYEIQMRRKDGDLVWVKVSGRPLMNEKNEVVGALAIHSNISKQKELEEQLTRANEDLESKVTLRTRELWETNQILNNQVKERKLAAIALRHSEKRFRDIFYNSPDAIYVENFEGVILDVNEATCNLNGKTRDEMIGKSVYDISPVAIHEEIKKRQPLIASGVIKSFETETNGNYGKVIPIEVKAAIIEYKDQPALLMHVRDISERRKAQSLLELINTELESKVKDRTRELEAANFALHHEIREKERAQSQIEKQKDYLRFVLDSNPNIIFVKDSEGKFTIANEATARFYGLSKNYIEGKKNAEFNPFPDIINELDAQDRAVLENNKEMVFPEVQFKNPKTGEVTWLHMVKKPIPGDKGKTNILGVSTNITELRKAREEMRLSEKLYRQIAANIPQSAIFIFDKDMRYIVAEGPLVGVVSKQKDQIEGRTIYEAFRPEDRAYIETHYKKILAGESSTYQYDYNGMYMLVRNSPIRDDNADILYGMVITLDITDLKKAQGELLERNVELQRSNEELERFAYVASHDLQGPLRTIASYLQLLESRYKNKLDKDATEFIDFSVSGAKRMQQLILDLLNYSRINSQPKPFEMTDMNMVMAHVIGNLESSIKNNSAVIEYDNLPKIMAQPNQLLQLLQNLVDNAIKFKGTITPRIRIATIEHEYEWEFLVSDNGIGIKEEFKEKIFQIFQRLHNDSEYPGTGVGLAICKKIVQLHGGKIWLESTYGKGTTFHFTVSKDLSNEKGREY
jgi:PAS domain S-box-containing protein